jgi:sulfide:quinone oxidoreductase
MGGLSDASPSRSTERLPCAADQAADDSRARRGRLSRDRLQPPGRRGADQPTFAEIEAAARRPGIAFRYLPIVSGKVATTTRRLLRGAGRTARPGARLLPHRHAVGDAVVAGRGGRRPLPEILAATKAAGYDMNGVARRIANGGRTPTDVGDAAHEVVIVGGGAAGIAVAASA